MSQRRVAIPFIACIVAVTALFFAAPEKGQTANAPPEVALGMDDQRFTPEEVHVKAGVPFMLVVRNQGIEEGEFEIPELKIEQEIPAGKTKRFKIPALRSGAYTLINDNKVSGAKGRLIAE